jgi:hypothetical protein
MPAAGDPAVVTPACRIPDRAGGGETYAAGTGVEDDAADVFLC